MRIMAFAALIALLPATSPVAADLSAEIASTGIAATRARLAALPAPDDAELFALGGLEFLGGIESALQLRWKIRLSPSLGMLPVLRLPIPDNPAPVPFEPQMVADLADGIAGSMQQASTTLQRIPEGSSFGLDLRPADIWFDIDGNGRRGPHEGLLEVAGATLFAGVRWDRQAIEAVTIRFDVADSRWLAAYSELLHGMALAVMAYDPTAALTDVLASNAELARLNADTQMSNALDMMLGNWVDSAAVVLAALDQQPDPGRAAEALAALEQVVDLNRAFWRLVAAEGDDDREWIPNDTQHSALGLEVPAGTGAAWLAVLDDLDALLRGQLLLPYWRLGDGVGLNLRRMFVEPRPVALPAWVQGKAALPYAERGKLIDADSLRRFDQLLTGRGLMFAIWIN